MLRYLGLNNNKNLLVFLIGLLSLIQVRVVGTFGIAELIAIAAFPFIKPFKIIQKNKRVKKMMVLLFLGIIGLIFANLYNNIGLKNSFKGVFFLTVFFIVIPFAYWLLNNNYRRILYYAAGLALSNILSFLFFPTSALQSMLEISGSSAANLMDVWFIYFLQPTAVIIAGLLYFKNKKKSSILFIIFFAVFSLVKGSRNIFLIWSIASMILLIIGDLTEINKVHKFKRIKSSLPFLIVLLFISLFGIKNAYQSFAEDGSLGERAKKKFMQQNYESGSLGILSSRIEFIIGLEAIYERPIIGYGSYPLDKKRLKELVYSKYKIELPHSILLTRKERLSGHSHLLNSYIYGGVLGVFFWLYAFSLVILFLRKYLFYDIKMVSFLIILIISWFWDFFFSPFAYRLQEAMLLVLITIMIQKAELSIQTINKGYEK